MYEPSRLLLACNIAGFQFWDGALVLAELKPGDAIQMVPEPDNPHDPDAVALVYQGAKLGFIPAGEAGPISLMMRFGHASAFECRVQAVRPDQEPWKQVRVGVYIVDAR